MAEPARHRRRRGFTLVELLTVIAVVGLLAALAIPVLGGARARARAATCAGRMRTLGQGFALHAQENRGRFPRSLHSAGSHQEPGWTATLAPLLGAPPTQNAADWTAAFNRLFRCPEDLNTDPTLFSYGLNVHFELTPDGDDYAGSPATWRTLQQVPTPARTILLAEARPVAFGDHFMAHLWSGTSAARNAVAHDRHGGGRAHYLYVDGHVAALPVAETYDPATGLDQWNPGRAR